MGVLSLQPGCWVFLNHRGGNLRVPRWLGGHREEQGSEAGAFILVPHVQNSQPSLGPLCQPRESMERSECVHPTLVELRVQGTGLGRSWGLLWTSGPLTGCVLRGHV